MYYNDFKLLIENESKKYHEKDTKSEELLKKMGNNADLLQHFGLLILMPDCIERGIANEVIDYVINKTSSSICAARLVHFNTYYIEELYKYSLRKKMTEGEKVYWWLIGESMKQGPAIAMLLYCNEHIEEFFYQTILSVKKNKKDNSGSIREKFLSYGKILNVVHSPDDLYSFIRESLIFFQEEELLHIFNNIPLIPTQSVKNLLSGYGERDYMPSAIKSHFLSRIDATIDIVSTEIPIQLISELNIRKEGDIQRLKLIRYGIENNNISTKLSVLSDELNQLNVFHTQWEIAFLQNAILFNSGYSL